MGGNRREFGLAVLGEIAQIPLTERDGFLFVGAEKVATSADRTMHLGAAQVLQGDLFSNDRLGHTRTAEIHRGISLDHQDDVAESGNVRTAGSTRSEQETDLRH